MKNITIPTLMAAVALSWLAAAGPAPAAEVLRFSHGTIDTNPHHLAAVQFAKEVEERTKGEIKVPIFPRSQLGTGKGVVEGILLGTIGISQPAAGVIANWAPELNVINMPFVFRDADHFEKVWTGPVFDRFSAVMAKKGIRMLGMFTTGDRHIMTKKAVFGMADLKGRKIRAIGNPVHVASFNAFGALATAIAYTEVYGSLQTGVVDGADAANTNYFNQKFYEVAPYWALVAWLNFSNPLIMSEKKFQSLSPEQQKILLEAGAKASVLQRRLTTASNNAKLGELLAKGVKVTVPDPAPFREASKKVYAEFLKTDTEKELMRLIQEAK
jgi:tripartite ATP-independent transporter DctP family solute receptor